MLPHKKSPGGIHRGSMLRTLANRLSIKQSISVKDLVVEQE